MQLVLDTNIVLDLLVFADPATQPVARGLEDGALDWIATGAMRDELARVLGYPKLAARVDFHRGSAQAVLADFDRQVRLVDVAAKAPLTCGDPDDQKFIDLAIAHRCTLLSKDFEVLRMRKRLAKLDVQAASALVDVSNAS
ncbi:MAG: PIN domain-containing protein [Comamonadaceae bacterium]|nr:MAG: PIN domain-containing protein [Comamonadaceae bacterium]